MKKFRLLSIALLSVAMSTTGFAQTTTETFNVSGNCGMCKTKIEKAAKDAGAKEADWNKETKQLTVKFNSTSTNAAKIQQKIAEVGYDNVGFKATNEAYDKLHGCCKYERASAVTDEKMECCKEGKCSKEGHEGKDCCKKDGGKMECSKEGHEGKDCCKKDGGKMECSKEGHEGKDCCKKDGDKKDSDKMDCCKDGKCSKPGHDGKDCCKKS